MGLNNAGYMTHIPWEHTYQYELCPHTLRFAMAVAGVEPVQLKSYCELAYGQGVTIAIHAACNQDVQWCGTDLNPMHFRSAKDLAENAGLKNLTLFDLDVSDFSDTTAGTLFDAVGMIGTWGWVPKSTQDSIIRFLSQRLAQRGVFCHDHSTLPGKSGEIYLHRIFASLAKTTDGTVPSVVERIPGAVQRTLKFLDTNPAISHHHWSLREMTEAVLKTDPNHAAHEYFNHVFQAEFFADLAARLAASQIQWACSLSPTASLSDLHLTPRQAKYLKTIDETVAREQLRDFMLDTSGRSDIWMRCATVPYDNRHELLRDFRFISAKPVDDFKYKIDGGLGQISLSRDLYGRLFDAFSCLQPMSIGVLQDRLCSHFPPDEICDAISILVSQGVVQVVNASEDEISRSRATSRALNRTILEMSLSDDTISYLGSPLTGGGIRVSRLHRLFLLASENGERGIDAWSRFAEHALSSDGSDPTDPAIIRHEAENFNERFLPVYSGLAIAER